MGRMEIQEFLDEWADIYIAKEVFHENLKALVQGTNQNIRPLT